MLRVTMLALFSVVMLSGCTWLSGKYASSKKYVSERVITEKPVNHYLDRRSIPGNQSYIQRSLEIEPARKAHWQAQTLVISPHWTSPTDGSY